MSIQRRIAVVGLGYVGLPVALAFARKTPNVVGYDVSKARVESLRDGTDSNADCRESDLLEAQITFTHEASDLEQSDFFIVAVPTPIDQDNRPDLSHLASASRLVGSVMKPGAIVVFESTVYPGVTEEFCLPILAETSGLSPKQDFHVGYSPERINPGDTEHSLERIIKVVAGDDSQTLDTIAAVYETIIEAGVHRAPSIQIAEAAKVIENTQRDLNIALMNELAIIFDRMHIPTRDVLAAAGTKWNFLRFSPGLVGGHCIGVDPYYLTTKAEQLGYNPQVILAGRRINDNMGKYIALKTIKLLVAAGLPVNGARVGVLGVTFKENVGDLRNSRVPDIVNELSEFGVSTLIHDPIADRAYVSKEYGLTLGDWDSLRSLDALILAVSHKHYLEMDLDAISSPLTKGGVLVDVKSALSPDLLRKDIRYWAL